MDLKMKINWQVLLVLWCNSTKSLVSSITQAFVLGLLIWNAVRGDWMLQAMTSYGELLLTEILISYKMVWNYLIMFNKNKSSFLLGTGGTNSVFVVVGKKKKYSYRKRPERPGGQDEHDSLACTDSKCSQLHSVLPGVQPAVEGRGGLHIFSTWETKPGLLCPEFCTPV